MRLKGIAWAMYLRDHKGSEEEVCIYKTITIYKIGKYFRCIVIPKGYSSIIGLKRRITELKKRGKR